MLRSTTRALEPWWSHGGAMPGLLLHQLLSKRFPFDIYHGSGGQLPTTLCTRSLSFDSMQNPGSGSKLLCLNLPNVFNSDTICSSNCRESCILFSATNQPLGRVALYMVPIRSDPMMVLWLKFSVALLRSLRFILVTTFSNTEICGYIQNYNIQSLSPQSFLSIVKGCNFISWDLIYFLLF